MIKAIGEAVRGIIGYRANQCCEAARKSGAMDPAVTLALILDFVFHIIDVYDGFHYKIWLRVTN